MTHPEPDDGTGTDESTPDPVHSEPDKPTVDVTPPDDNQADATDGVVERPE